MIVQLKNLLISLLCCGLFLPATLAAQSPDHETVDHVWIYSPFDSGVSRSKVAPFFQAMGQQFGADIQIQTSSAVENLYRHCATRAVDIVFVAQVYSGAVIEQCRYRPIVETTVVNTLFVPVAHRDQPLASFKRLGVLRGTQAAIDTRKELVANIADGQLISYQSLLDMMAATAAGEIDGFVIGRRPFEQVTPSVRHRYHPVMALQRRGRILVLTSPLLSARQRRAVTDFFMADTDLTRQVWQQGFGLEPFTVIAP